MVSQPQIQADRRHAVKPVQTPFYRALNELERLRALRGMEEEQSQSPVGKTTHL